MDKYAVVGNPIAHSKSPFIHAAFAKQCGQNLQYSALLSQETEFEKDLKEFFNEGLGLNVTVPFKLKAYEFADQLSETAKKAGAVNTLIKKECGQIVGDNTDGIGLVNDLLKNQKLPLKDKRVLIIGAGGATQGVLLPLLKESPKAITIANRTFGKAQALSEKFSENKADLIQAIALEELENQQVDIIINASSAGLSGESAPLPTNLKNTFCYDMVYGSELTPFLKSAQAKGCEQFADGLGMLVEQAAESFYLWRSVRPDTQPVLESLRLELKT